MKFRLVPIFIVLLLLLGLAEGIHVITQQPDPDQTLREAQKVIESQNYCLELGDCMGKPTELKVIREPEGTWYRCEVLHTSESWYAENLQIVKATCNAFDRLGVLRPHSLR